MKNSDSLFNKVFYAGKTAMVLMDKNLRGLIYNDAFAKITGRLTSAEGESVNIPDFLSNEEDVISFKETAEKVFNSGLAPECGPKYRIKNGDNDPVEFLLTMTPFDEKEKILVQFHKTNQLEYTGLNDEKIKNLVSSYPIPQYVINKDHKIIIWNNALEEMTGVKAEDITGNSESWKVFYGEPRYCIADLVLEKKEEELISRYGPSLLKNTGQKFAYQSKIYLEKYKKWCMVTASQITDSEGKPIGAFALFEDITTIKETEDNLKITNRQLEDIIEFLPDATMIIDNDGKVNAWNRAMEEMTGLLKKDIIGKPHEYVTVPFYGYPRKYLVDYLDTVNNSPDDYSFVERRRDSVFGEAYASELNGGKGAHIWAIASYLKDDSGRILGAIESVRDISRFKEAEEALKISEESYKSLYDNNPSMYFTIDAEGTVLSVNKFGCEALGYSLAELVGGSVLKVFHEEDMTIAVEKTRQCIDNIGQVYIWELRKKRKNQEILWVKETARALKVKDGKIVVFIVCEDITEQKLTEKALIESETRYKELYEDNPSMYFTITPEFNILSVNRFGCEQLGYDSNEITGQSVLNLFHEEDKEKAQSFLQLCVNNIGQVFNWELRKTGKNRKPLWVKETGRALINNNNSTVIFIVSEDISEKRRAEEFLQESEKKYRQLVNNSFVGIYTLQNDKIKFCNQKFADYFGYDSAKELIGLNHIILVAPEYRAAISTEIEKNSSHYEFKGIKKDGAMFDAEVIASRFISEGKPTIQGTLIDISERKRNEREIHKLSRAVEQNPAGIMITDLNGRIEYVNPSFEKITELTFEEIKGRNFRTLRDEYSDYNTFTQIWNTIIRGQEWKGELKTTRKDGLEFWEAVSISAIKNEKGEITHFILVEEDVTKKKELELELKRAVDRAEESNRLKTSLLSNMSHELRTPLTGILGLSQILLEEFTNSHFASLIKKIYYSGKRLMITLNSILDLSEIESNTALIKTVVYDICGEIRYLLSQYEIAAEEKGLTFEIEIADRKSAVFADERMCNQIIINLVDNAVKYTFSGGIKIKIESRLLNGSKFIQLCVSDTGIGISNENIPIIFEEFRQVSEGYNRSFEGAGLGLTLVKKMLKLIGGEIAVESRLDEGSSFTILLPATDNPYSIDEEERQQITDEVSGNVKRVPFADILLVEDNEINTEVIKCYIESFCNVENAGNGVDAIAMAAKKKYDVILMDINLGSDMDGVTASKEIRKIAGYKDTPIVAITGYALSGDKEKLFAEGLTHYLPKPFEKDDLQKLLKGILQI
jgi:PAS domain S-box-containing protein